MIKSYYNDIKSRRNKAAVFWFLVFMSSIFLYLFFQGYYPSIEFRLDGKNSKNPTPILKQFGIINIKSIPSPDNIFINGKGYSNESKKMVDYGKYKVEIYKTGAISSEFDVVINADYPIFFEDIHLFNKFTYKKFGENYARIEKIENYYLTIKTDGKIIILDKDFNLYGAFNSDFAYIGYKYFVNNSKIFIYDYTENKIKPLLKTATEKQLQCQKPIVYTDKIFCFDEMTFLTGDNIPKKNEKILNINQNLIMTNENIYSNSSQSSWSPIPIGSIVLDEPENIINIENETYLLENGILYLLENSNKTKFEISEVDEIKKTTELDKETIIIGYKGSETRFVIIKDKRKYVGNLGKINTNLVSISKINGAYFISTDKNLFLYYKGANQIKNILVGDNIKIIEKRVFFNKGKTNYYLDIEENN